MKRAERFSSDSSWSEYGTLTRKKFDHSFSLQCTVSITVQTCPNRFVKKKKYSAHTMTQGTYVVGPHTIPSFSVTE